MMILGFLLLGAFALCGASRPPRRGAFAPASEITADTPLIIEGDIAVTEKSTGPPTLNIPDTAHTVPGQELNISKKMTTKEAWTFYLLKTIGYYWSRPCLTMHVGVEKRLCPNPN